MNLWGLTAFYFLIYNWKYLSSSKVESSRKQHLERSWSAGPSGKADHFLLLGVRKINTIVTIVVKHLPLLFLCADVHTEAVQAALAKYKERKMPMPSKRRSILVHSSMETYTPPGTDKWFQDGFLWVCHRPGAVIFIFIELEYPVTCNTSLRNVEIKKFTYVHIPHQRICIFWCFSYPSEYLYYSDIFVWVLLKKKTRCYLYHLVKRWT